MPTAVFANATGIAAQQYAEDLLHVASTKTISTLMQMAQASY